MRIRPVESRQHITSMVHASLSRPWRAVDDSCYVTRVTTTGASPQDIVSFFDILHGDGPVGERGSACELSRCSGVTRITDVGRVERAAAATAGQSAKNGATAQRAWAPDRKYGWIYGGLVWALILNTAVPADMFGGTDTDVSQLWAPNPLTRFIKVAELGVAAFLIIRRASLSWVLLRSVNPFMLLFMAVAFLSILWSIDPAATMARFITLMSIITVSFAFGLGGWHARRFQAVIRPALTIVLVGSLIYGIVAPERAIEVGEGTLKNAWHGLTSQKNQLGEVAGLGVLFWFHAYIAHQVKGWQALLGLAAAGACLLLSRSSSSLLSTVFACVLIAMLLRMPGNLRPYVPYVVAIFASVVALYAIAALNLVPGLDAVLTPVTLITGKDMTFSNRSQIWGIIEEHIKLSPFLGSGYGAYWTGLIPGTPSYVFLSRMYFYPSQSHNGYLEIINDLGLLGIVVLLAYLAVYVRQALQLMRIDRIQATLFLSLFFQHMMVNLSETAWFATSSQLTTTVMSVATVCIARALLEGRFQRVWGRPASRPR